MPKRKVRMTFSQEVKEELEKHINSSRHCQLAEMAAYVLNEAEIGESLVFKADNEGLARKIFTLIKKTYNINALVEQEIFNKTTLHKICITDKEDIHKVLSSVKYDSRQGKTVSPLIVKNSCCKRAYLQGTFLCIGSMSSPDKSYHLEFSSSDQGQLEQIKNIIADFDIEARITSRKKGFVLYVKEGESIVDLLNIMGAHVSLMNMENVIILKNMRNTLNRRVNCETANIIKSVNASTRQIDDINYIIEHKEYEKLPDALKDMADVRLKNPDTPLKDLGALLDPPVGKSGVNHRLRRLSEIAEELRSRNGER